MEGSLQRFKKRLQHSDITQQPPAAEPSKRYLLANLTGIAVETVAFFLELPIAI
jgi:hypothetical protein